jgi:hypothetical protein
VLERAKTVRALDSAATAIGIGTSKVEYFEGLQGTWVMSHTIYISWLNASLLLQEGHLARIEYAIVDTVRREIRELYHGKAV